MGEWESLEPVSGDRVACVPTGSARSDLAIRPGAGERRAKLRRSRRIAERGPQVAGSVRRVKRASALALLVASLALVAAGCGGDDEASADPTAAWAEGFCSAITTWTDSITDATDELRSLSSLDRDSFEQAAEDIRSATSDFGDDLRSLGSPETESGDEAKQAIDDFATTLDEDSADIEASIQDVSGITDLPGAVQDITTSLSSMNAAFSTMLKAIRTGDAQDELQTAFENADACDDVG